jgi:hypothetical protein
MHHRTTTDVRWLAGLTAANFAAWAAIVGGFFVWLA